jgi:malate synthase
MKMQAAALKLADFFGNDDILYLMEDLATGDSPKHSLGMGS